MSITSVPHCADCTGRYDDHVLVDDRGDRIGGSYYGQADYVDPSAPWYSWGPAGLQAGFSTRDEAEAAQSTTPTAAGDPSDRDDAPDTWHVGPLAVVLDRADPYPRIRVEDEGHTVMTFNRFTATELAQALLQAVDRANL